jgi:hypothetical protein
MITAQKRRALHPYKTNAGKRVGTSGADFRDALNFTTGPPRKSMCGKFNIQSIQESSAREAKKPERATKITVAQTAG